MRHLNAYVAIGLLVLSSAASAATLVFNTDPFAGSTALTTPGRQVIGGLGESETFEIASDVLAFDLSVFGLTQLSFANGLTTEIPETGVNFVVVRNGPPLNAGAAANAIAARVTESGPGFFIYFNTGLDLPRLVYSTDLNSTDADLSILARFTNLGGDAGFEALSTVTAANIQAIPEPSSIFLMSIGGVLLGIGAWRGRRLQA